MRRRYRGIALETGGTSINAKVSPGVKWLLGSGAFDGAEEILDYGAGKYDRNADYLRKKGFRVYTFDPYNGGANADGWTSVSARLPKARFKAGFSNYVLNVVPEYVEQNIVENLAKRCEHAFHVVRDDVFKMAKKSLSSGCNTACRFFLDEFATEEEKELYHQGSIPKELIQAFCEHGMETKAGFQRHCTSEDYGLEVVHHKKKRFKIYRG